MGFVVQVDNESRLIGRYIIFCDQIFGVHYPRLQTTKKTSFQAFLSASCNYDVLAWKSISLSPLPPSTQKTYLLEWNDFIFYSSSLIWKQIIFTHTSNKQKTEFPTMTGKSVSSRLGHDFFFTLAITVAHWTLPRQITKMFWLMLGYDLTMFV